ncbi:peptidoglycan DD-metalloendopeptidase family protein [Marivirga salinae]|uniref:Peptidoglycan DD-metalloendopeptidase family protein n=1 Tax=Marivirga salinarum TaxID=3059078 RepID=A0AA51R8U4_9BACT|nr:T9SS type A sorting domain-containing protein [Marivirga sp. BDSF4-3]WMN11582.1 peptidoglycan DD-metalloendopeptidase family protein [Marivirga sp. BDSF4-3]
MNRKLSFLALIFFSITTLAQKVEFTDFGKFSQENFICNQENIHKKFQAEIQYIKDSLISGGMLKINSERYEDDHVLLEWPVAQNVNFTEPDYYGISNYVDHDSSYPDQIQDYNCGSISYDLPSGYNHAGVDIFSSPFPWMKMNNNQVVAVAAASGTIIYKVGENYDKNCDFNNTEGWNAVYIAHEDGSTAWYGHLKENSLTEKSVGEAVTTGEYLGVIGSSGSSTGPHLHFELYNAANELIDPYVGPCNPTTSTSWWRDQKTYKNPRILKLMTHSNPPIPYGCYSEEIYNAEINFSAGQTVLLATYLADQTVGEILYHRLISPDGSVYDEWDKEFENNYSSSYWYYSLPVNNELPKGKWTYQVVYEDQEIVSHNFYIKDDSDEAILSTQENVLVNTESDYFTINLKNTGSIGLNIKRFESSEALNIDWEGDIAPNDSKEVLVQLKGDISDGNQFIEIFHNSDINPTTVYVTTESVSIINSNITNYDFGEVMLEVYDTLKLPIENSGLAVLQVQDVILPDNFHANKVNFQIQPQQTDTLEVYFKPMEEKEFNGTMSIVSNASNNSELKIDLSGIGIPNLLLSNDQELAKSLKLYPNPTSNELNISYELIDDTLCSISIVDTNGKVFYNSSFLQELNKEQTINVEELPEGMYFLKLINEDNRTFFKKFIKR